jgi:hypothetical protein
MPCCRDALDHSKGTLEFDEIASSQGRKDMRQRSPRQDLCAPYGASGNVSGRASSMSVAHHVAVGHPTWSIPAEQPATGSGLLEPDEFAEEPALNRPALRRGSRVLLDWGERHPNPGEHCRPRRSGALRRAPRWRSASPPPWCCSGCTCCISSGEPRPWSCGQRPRHHRASGG